jgi:protein KRI1
MPTRFKYTRSKPTAFGLTPAEILLATDKELDQIAGLRHIAPYRKQGLGMQGRGISKRIYDLKQKLRNRKWGEEMEYDQDGKPITIERNRDAGWGDKKRKNADGEGEGEGGEKKKKRLGKKQRERERMARADGGVGVEPSGSASGPAVGNRYEEPVAAPAHAEQGEEKEGKARRRKKKTSQQKEELKIFD